MRFLVFDIGVARNNLAALSLSKALAALGSFNQNKKMKRRREIAYYSKPQD